MQIKQYLYKLRIIYGMVATKHINNYMIIERFYIKFTETAKVEKTLLDSS
jgi:hypothetical protein